MSGAKWAIVGAGFLSGWLAASPAGGPAQAVAEPRPTSQPTTAEACARQAQLALAAGWRIRSCDPLRADPVGGTINPDK